MRRVALVVLSAFVLALLGCQGNFSERASQAKGNVFRYPIVTNPTTLDPGKVQDGDTIDLIQQVFSGLVTWSPDNKVVPDLAERWDLSPDRRTYTFHLRKGAKFQNGREVTADDFKFTIERNADPAFASQTIENYLGDVVGVMDKLHGKAKDVSGVKVVDKYTLAITIDKPRPYFLGKLTYPVSYPVAKEAVKPGQEITSPEEMVGTGPFQVTRFVPDQIVILKAFPEFYGGKPLIDGIERPVIKDDATRLSKFKTGELDLVQLERKDVAGLQADSTYKDDLHFFDRPAIWYIAMNVRVAPVFADRRVRRAFAMAIDRDKIVNQVLGGINKTATGILPPSVPGYRPKTALLGYDPEGARKLLAEAGFPGGKGFPSVEMVFREQRPDVQLVAEAAQQMLKANLGVTITLRTMEWSQYLAANDAKRLPMFHMRWSADYLDAQNFLSLLLTTTGNENKTYYSNPQVDALCAKADALFDEAERAKLYAQAEDLVLQDAIWVPIYYQRDAELISPRVKGLRESVFGHLPHTTVSLAKT